MKVTEKQLLVMLRVLEGSLSINDRTDMNLFCFDYKTRAKVWSEIMNQQDNTLVDIKDKEE